MANKPIIVVCGATGIQGSSVVHHLVSDNVFAVRALVRSPESASAKKLSSEGIELVQGDFDDIDSLKRAFSSAHGVYAITDYFEVGADKERQQGYNIIDAAKTCGVQHFILSTVETTQGSKYEVDQYLRKSGIPRTTLYLALYLSNILMAFQRASGTIHGPVYDLNIPYPSDAQMPAIASEDIGAWVSAAFLDPQEWIGKDMKPCSEIMTPREYAAVYEEVTGISVNVVSLSREKFMEMGETGVLPPDEWAKMKWFLDIGANIQCTKFAYTIYPAASDWRTYLREHLDEKPVPNLHIPMQVDVTITSDDH